jgi:hypothetical protein
MSSSHEEEDLLYEVPTEAPHTWCTLCRKGQRPYPVPGCCHPCWYVHASAVDPASKNALEQRWACRCDHNDIQDPKHACLHITTNKSHPSQPKCLTNNTACHRGIEPAHPSKYSAIQQPHQTYRYMCTPRAALNLSLATACRRHRHQQRSMVACKVSLRQADTVASTSGRDCQSFRVPAAVSSWDIRANLLKHNKARVLARCSVIY